MRHPFCPIRLILNRRAASCASRPVRQEWGNGTTRSLRPLPSRTTIMPRSMSTSLTRNRTASIKRIPEPYMSRAISA